MDAIVEAALRKWPNVPHCYGWLALDARGDWYMRDERIQRAGPFPAVKGSRIEHAKLIDFIGRNYASDANGCWFFQNGPQRVYVELEVAPWIWRLEGDDARSMRVVSHTGVETEPRAAFVDENGRLYLDGAIGFGLVHTLDMDRAADAVEAGRFAPQEARSAELPQRFGYRLAPMAPAAPQPP